MPLPFPSANPDQLAEIVANDCWNAMSMAGPSTMDPVVGATASAITPSDATALLTFPILSIARTLT